MQQRANISVEAPGSRKAPCTHRIARGDRKRRSLTVLVLVLVTVVVTVLLELVQELGYQLRGLR
jgi:hypothetical protein